MSGLLEIVGLGPGAPEHRTAAACTAVRAAQTVIGYGPYLDYCADLLAGTQNVVRWGIGEEPERARDAVTRAAAGERVALISTGDPGVYGMAARTLALAAELPEPSRPRVRVLPGVTAALAASALLGAPLSDDFAVISLSDLHVEWEVIERRLAGLAASGVALCLYNPRSRTRTWQLSRVLEILREHRGERTVAGVITDAGRQGERTQRATLATLDEESVTMRSVLIIAGESTRMAGPWLIAERAARAEVAR